MAVETSIISRIAMHATAESALPTLVAAGNNITVANWGVAGYSTIGSRNIHQDDFDIGEDGWNFGAEAEEHMVEAPLSIGTDDVILLGRKTEAFDFKLYDMDVLMLAFGSDITVTSNVASHASTYTKRALAFEVHGQGIYVMPKCILKFSNFEMGAKEVNIVTATVKPLSTSSYPMGWYYEQY